MDLRRKHSMYGLLAALAIAGLTAVAGAPALDKRSDKDAGLVTVSSDLVLNDGRLVIKIVAFNKGGVPAELTPAKISVTTAAGKPVPLASLAQLEDETRVAFGAKPVHRPGEYASTSAMQRPDVMTPSGERDVSGYTGSSGTISTATPTRGKKGDETNNPELKTALDNLRAAILQPVTVASKAADGGNIVTQAIKFSRKEGRGLLLTVEFANERHEFEFEVPRSAE